MNPQRKGLTCPWCQSALPWREYGAGWWAHCSRTCGYWKWEPKWR